MKTQKTNQTPKVDKKPGVIDVVRSASTTAMKAGVIISLLGMFVNLGAAITSDIRYTKNNNNKNNNPKSSR